MYHLTTTQYGILRTSAYNVCELIGRDPDNASFHLEILIDHIGILTGEFSGDLYDDAWHKAKELNASDNKGLDNAKKLLEFFIGPFTTDEWTPPSELQEILSKPLPDETKAYIASLTTPRTESR